jgi:hypothetical protein
MFFEGAFRDVDGRNGKPIMLEGHADVMMLAPVTCGVATPEQTRAVRPMFRSFQENPGPALEWPPLLFTYAEAAWNADERATAAAVIASTADRVYRRTDERSTIPAPSGDPYTYRIPGVASEYWPVKDVAPGGENYGWGATLPALILRAIVGFRECPGDPSVFFLAPSLPLSFLVPRRTYAVRKLHYGGVTFDLVFSCRPDDVLRVAIQYTSPTGVSLKGTPRGAEMILASTPVGKDGNLSFDTRNGNVVAVHIVEK